MLVFNQPYNHLIAEDYMSKTDFDRCRQSIDFKEIQHYCSNPEVSEHDNSLHGNYSMPVDETNQAGWLFDYFANNKTFDLITQKLYGHVLKADHCYINLHWDNALIDTFFILLIRFSATFLNYLMHVTKS